jgi:hypothetical protein
MRDVGFEISLDGASPQSIVSWCDPRFFHVPRSKVLLLISVAGTIVDYSSKARRCHAVCHP